MTRDGSRLHPPRQTWSGAKNDKRRPSLAPHPPLTNLNEGLKNNGGTTHWYLVCGKHWAHCICTTVNNCCIVVSVKSYRQKKEALSYRGQEPWWPQTHRASGWDSPGMLNPSLPAHWSSQDSLENIWINIFSIQQMLCDLLFVECKWGYICFPI